MTTGYLLLVDVKDHPEMGIEWFEAKNLEPLTPSPDRRDAE